MSLKFPAELEGALFFMATNSPESYETRIVTGAQVLSTWGEWVYGTLADADKNDVIGFSETVADPDCWYQVNDRLTTLEWAVGEDADIFIHRITQLDGVALIAVERQRQVSAEGWTPEHDDKHIDESMAAAAACFAAPRQIYTRHETKRGVVMHDPFPWGRVVHCGRAADDPDGWHSYTTAEKKADKDRLRQLVIAGALIAAEIDRLNRAKAGQGGES